jgi:trimethylamine--corrinoid protein Co-methyltransferase
MSKYLYAGIPVNDLTMVVDEIVEVGPGGDYISRESTLKGMSGLTNSNLIDRQVREAWEAAGSPEFYANAKKEARRILAEHEVEPLPDDVAAEIRTIVQRVDRECGVTFESPV